MFQERKRARNGCHLLGLLFQFQILRWTLGVRLNKYEGIERRVDGPNIV